MKLIEDIIAWGND